MTSQEITIDITFELYKKLKLQFLKGYFHLRKWRTNNQNFVKKLMKLNLPQKNYYKLLKC